MTGARREGGASLDEAIGELLAVSSDIRQAAVLDAEGAVIGRAPGADGDAVASAADGLWQAAASAALAHAQDEAAALEHVFVDLGDAAVIALAAGGRRIVALTAAEPALGLALFDLRTCLADAFPDEGPRAEGDVTEPA